jgi:glutamate racemase
MRKPILQIPLILLFLLFSCNKPGPVKELPIEHIILNEKENFFFVNFDDYPKVDNNLSIGIFDSGTGGLTILDALVKFDQYGNATQLPGNDGIPDFASEKFIYLADQANMPYGNYYKENKSDLLVEHILKDAQFLLSNKYYQSGSSLGYKIDKQSVKVIVIACNTATAYGKEPLEDFVRKSGLDLKIIGVIDAGAKGALEIFNKNESGSIGVLATAGTIASEGYERAIKKLIAELRYTGNIMIFNQGGHGLAEALDGETEFIKYDAKNPRENYKGPSLNHPDYKIEKALWDTYHFNFDKNKILCNAAQVEDCSVLQLNDPENYVRFHLVSMLEQLRKTPGAVPLKALLLGCTHYPYLSNTINQVLNELYHYKKNGNYVYRSVMAKEIKLIDPAVNVAKELYDFMKQQNLFNSSSTMDSSEFYISVPNLRNHSIKLDSLGRFTYEYKYGRNAGQIQEYVKVVPFSKQNIPNETLIRLQKAVPGTYELIKKFNGVNSKASFLLPQDKISDQNEDF